MENRFLLTLDFKLKTIRSINFIQNNVGTSVLELTIVDGGQVTNSATGHLTGGNVVDITGQAVSIAFLKPDNTLVIQDETTGVSILEPLLGKIQCVLMSNTLAAVGIIKAEVSFSQDGNKLSTTQFNFTCSSSLDNGAGVLSSNIIPAVDAQIAEWQTELETITAEYALATLQNTDIEIVAARGGEVNLGTRLDVAEALAVSHQADNSTLLGLKADKTYTDTQIASLASGSPKGVYATLALLQAAFPTGNTNTYVVTADGKWYYWNASAWTAGAVYQGVLLADSIVAANNMTDGMPTLKAFNMFNPNDADFVDGYYVNPVNGALVASSTSSVTGFIPVTTPIQYTITNSNHMAWYNASKVFISGVNASANQVVLAPVSPKFVKISIVTSAVPIFMMVEGLVLPEDYVPYSFAVLGKNKVTPVVVDSSTATTSSKFDSIKALNELILPDILLYNQGSPVGATLDRYLDPTSPLGTNVVEVTYNATTATWGYKTSIQKSIASLGYGLGDYLQFGYFIKNITSTAFDYGGLVAKVNGVVTRIAALGTVTLANGWVYKYYRRKLSQADIDNNWTIQEFSFTTVSTAGALVNYKIQAPVITLSHQLLNLSDVILRAIAQAKTKDTIYHFQTLNTLGDSITEQGKWQGEVILGLRFQKYRNYGIGGTRLSGNAADDMVNRYLTMDDNADVVIVMGGTNDHSQQIAIGDDVTYDKTTFKGALRVLIEGLMVKYHDKKIFFMTPPHKSFAGTIPMRTYAEAIKSICYDYSIPVIDLFGESGINNSNIDIYLADGTHPNELGGTRIGDFVARKMKTF